MAAIANVVLTDQAAANHTFGPISAQPDKAVWMENDNTLAPIEQGSIVLQFRRARSNGEASKVDIRLAIPLVEAIDGVDTVVGVDRAEIKFLMPGAGSYQRRRDLLAMTRDLIDEAIVTSLVEDLETVY